MSDPNYTAVLFILDSSGSMNYTHESLQKALHLMLQEQARKLAGYITVDVGYFDHTAYEGAQNADPMLVNLGMFAAGGTQIFDTSAVLLANFESRLAKLSEDKKPGHVVVIVVTDGDSSGPTTSGGLNLKNYVTGKISEGWDFAFLGADQSSFRKVSMQFGIPQKNGIYHPLNKSGIRDSARELGEFISMTRAGERAHF